MRSGFVCADSLEALDAAVRVKLRSMFEDGLVSEGARSETPGRCPACKARVSAAKCGVGLVCTALGPVVGVRLWCPNDCCAREHLSRFRKRVGKFRPRSVGDSAAPAAAVRSNEAF